jgi:hypothetical protein
MPNRAVHAARTSASETGASFAPSDKLEWMGGRPREMLGIEGLLYKDRSFMLPWWLLLASGPYGETSPSWKTLWYIYYKLKFRHQCQCFSRPSHLHDTGNLSHWLPQNKFPKTERRQRTYLLYRCISACCWGRLSIGNTGWGIWAWVWVATWCVNWK